MAEDLQERIAMITLRNNLRARLQVTKDEHSIHLKAIESLQERISARTLEIRKRTQENNDLRSRLESTEGPPPSPGLNRVLQNYKFAAQLPEESEELAFEARLPPSAVEAYVDRFRTFEREIEHRFQDLEAREIAYQECQRKMEECENAIRIANDELAEHQPVLLQLQAVERDIARLTEFCRQKAEYEATYAELQAAYREMKGKEPEKKSKLDPNIAREYLEAVAERDRITQSQDDWTRRVRQLAAKLPGFAPV
jgi:hypothetical protein